jgi:hypothetical protein
VLKSGAVDAGYVPEMNIKLTDWQGRSAGFVRCGWDLWAIQHLAGMKG